MGVYLPGVLMMFGVIIYLRFSWILGNLGLTSTLAVILFSALIMMITALSIASAATNRDVGSGGTYYMVSRSLGIEIGSAIGVPLFLAQTLSISFCSIGFAESIQPFFPTIPIVYTSVATVIGLMALVYTSASIALKTQLLIFLIIMGSLASLFFGVNIDPETVPQTPPSSIPFWVGFAIFFPAMTGVESGVSMSGDLISPRKSLPLGSIGVIGTGFIVYLVLALFLHSQVPASLLVSDPLVMQHIAKVQLLIIAGIWVATLSSVLSGLLAAPRTLQALALDGIFPKFLAREWGKNKEPRIATLFCFALSILGVVYGSIDQIAPVLSMFCLIAYATLNLATGLEGIIGNPSWRPTFRIHWSISMLGVVLCLIAMFMINAGTTLVALLLVLSIFAFTKKRKLATQWEDIRHGLLVFLSRFAIYKLAHKETPTRAWRPNFLVLSNNPTNVSRLVDVTASIGTSKGFLTIASIISPNMADHQRMELWKKMVNSHLKQHSIEALVEFCTDENLLAGAKQFLSNYGMGSLSPNTVVLGEIKKVENAKDYFGIVMAACAAKKNVVIVRDQQADLPSTKKIHVWWDDTSKANSELMLLLSYMLTNNKKHKKSEIHLNSIVSNESGKEQRQTYFNDFFSKARVPVTSNIYVKEKNTSLWDIITQASQDGDMVLIGMTPPENLDEFEQLYFEAAEATSKIPNAAFVICAEPIVLSEIFT